jgi:hypothetical protein
MAPEVLQAESYDIRADTYSFALVIWAMLTGETRPYKSIGQKNMVTMVVQQHYREQIPAYTPENLENMIKNCWDPIPSNRPFFADILQTLTRTDFLGSPPRLLYLLEHIGPYLDSHTLIALSLTSQQFYIKVKDHLRTQNQSFLRRSGKSSKLKRSRKRKVRKGYVSNHL